MRFARTLFVGLVALASAACTSTDTGPTRTEVPPLAFVRYINAVPDTFNTTVRWVDDVQFTPHTFLNVGYRQEGLGGFQGLRAGDRHLRVFLYQQVGNDFPPAVNTTVMVDTTFNFVAGQYYTMIHAGFSRTGANPADRLIIIQDDPPASPAAGILLRVYNLSYTNSWDVRFGANFDIRDTIFGVPDTTITGPDTVITLDTATTGEITVDTAFVYDTTIVRHDTVSIRDTIPGRTYTAAQAGTTVIASGAPGNVETVVRPYSAAGLSAALSTRLFNAGALTGLGMTRVVAPPGQPETADFEAVGGSNINGSVITMWVFDRKTAGSPNSTGVVNTRPSVLFTVDRKPARTIAP
jgi:hypothetical protein